jgi:two-component system, NtrC family, response regulator AtoC
MNQGVKIFVVEDDVWYCNLLEYHLSLNPDYEIKKMHSAQECLAALHENPAIITLDYSLPDKNGAALMQAIKAFNPDIQVVIISGQEDVATAVELLKLGAYDYIVKNEDTKDRLWNTVNNIRQTLCLKEEISTLKEELGIKYDISKAIIGNSDSIKRVYTLIEKAAKSNITVSITGETGTGKELVAKAIHYNSERRKKPHVTVNVAAIPRELLESELFGHEKGAFTGAVTRRIGKFEEAHKGTLFLDEIGELDLSLQAKLLRVLQEKEVTRVGSNATIAVDVRIIVATHRNLLEEVKKGNFREDLYYRLLGLPIALPPLRERDKDVLVLAKHFINTFCQENKMRRKTLSPGAQQKLLSYSYPGNVRELRALIELALVMADEDVIQESDISLHGGDSIENLLSQELTLKDYTTRIIQHFLNKYNGNIIQTAKKLDIGKSTIYKMVQERELQVS